MKFMEALSLAAIIKYVPTDVCGSIYIPHTIGIHVVVVWQLLMQKQYLATYIVAIATS